ncbi:uncharacterized protein LOC119558267 isoform X2 [Drosophila subpulchrella]|uniref:uncharacterized protein LOC119558267 isoform X2 n=1 Tax=Drosophila subpulchrella TaxID=1486046 RepID=UPI0018A157D0|nr:uncharacterized protein LOC119558267 isoform X2 [Drosophila subpulchrella]
MEKNIEELLGEVRGIHQGLNALTEAVGSLTAYVRQSGKVDTKIVETMERSFPLCIAEDLQGIDTKLVDGNSENYTKLMVTLLKNGRLSRSILNVLSEDLVLPHNLEGGQNKKKLKAYPNFVRALLRSSRSRR